MDQQTPTVIESAARAAKPARHDVSFGVNEIRLSARQWLAVLGIVTACLVTAPRLWKTVERFPTRPDYRIPYTLSRDYWLYQRRLEQIRDPAQIVVLGDSVVWGEYVRPTGTLSHFLNRETAQPDRFINAGVNGLFPLAMEGLVRNYGGPLRGRKILVYWNVLWLSSPRADLRLPQEEAFNHSRLVPQFIPRIACYRADASERISAVIERNVAFSQWVGHLQDTCFNQRSIPNWTLEDNGGSAPQFPNAYRSPLAQVHLTVPAEPEEDPQRGPRSARHKPWYDGGAGPTHFDWVDLDGSLQWRAFQRTVALLSNRRNSVLVIVGPFNEHMIAEDQRPAYRALRDDATAWLVQNHIAHVVPEVLPSELYADASHPLTDGYALLAKELLANKTFSGWLEASASAP